MSVILAVKTETKCKICSSAHRDEIDQLILKRSERLLSLADVLARMADLGLDNPTKENIQIHRQKHCRIVDDELADSMGQGDKHEMGEKALALCTREFGEGWQDRILTNDEFLTFVRISSQYDLIMRMKSGEKTGVTVDQGLKSVDSGTRRKFSEAESEMRKGIGMAIQAVARRAALPPGPRVENDIPEIVENAEYEDITDREDEQ